jgi:hypothetical protein
MAPSRKALEEFAAQAERDRAELQRLADQAEEDRRAFQERADICAAQRDESLAMLKDLDTKALTPQHRHNTVDDVNTAISSNALRSQARMADDVKKHRLVVAMEKKGLTFAEVAEALEKKLGRKFPRSTVQSWPKPKGDVSARGIPRDAADHLRGWLGVPLSAWSRVIPD